MKRRIPTEDPSAQRTAFPLRFLAGGGLFWCLLVLVGCQPGDDFGANSDPSTKSETVVEGNNEGGDASVTPAPETMPPMDEFEAADLDFERGLELFGEGKYAEALVFLEKAVRIDTENEELEYHIAYCLSRLKRPEEAIKHYQRTLEIFPDFAEAHNNLGNLLMSKRAFALAEVHFKRSIEIEPEVASAHNNLGSLLSRQGRVGEAIPLFVESIRLDSEYVEARCNLGNAYLVQGRANESLLEFSRALELRPNFRPAVVGVQRARVKLGTIQVP